VAFPKAAIPVVLTAVTPVTLVVVQRGLIQGWRMAMSTAGGAANTKRVLSDGLFEGRSDTAADRATLMATLPQGVAAC
jgi:hypothetical protein